MQTSISSEDGCGPVGMLYSVWGYRLSDVTGWCSAIWYEDALVLFQLSGGGAVRIILASASASSSIRAICPKMERRSDWIIAVQLGCLVILVTSSLRTKKQKELTMTSVLALFCLHPPPDWWRALLFLCKFSYTNTLFLLPCFRFLVLDYVSS